MTKATTDEQLSGLLCDADCPYALYWKEYWADVRSDDEARRDSMRVIEVEALRRFARDRLGEVVDLNDRLDRVVERAGGKRTGVTDPWTAPRRLVRRLSGKANATTDVYEIPRHVGQPTRPPSPKL